MVGNDGGLVFLCPLRYARMCDELARLVEWRIDEQERNSLLINDIRSLRETQRTPNARAYNGGLEDAARLVEQYGNKEAKDRGAPGATVAQL
jgi:hypothetical protein